MTIISKNLTVKEKKFCRFFAGTGNASAAAQRAGFSENPEQRAQELLCRDEITKELERLFAQRERLFAGMAATGYQRLAFGDISDAVSLLFMQSPSRAELKGMDLFLVSEIKRPKDGSMEIKFFDRLKALEKLESKSGGSGDKIFFDAIALGAAAVGSEEDA